MTLKKDSDNYDFLEGALLQLCDNLNAVIIKQNKAFKIVGIQLTQIDLSNKTKSRMLKNPTSSLEMLQKTSKQLLREMLDDKPDLVRRLGVKVSDLTTIEGQSNITNYF